MGQFDVANARAFASGIHDPSEITIFFAYSEDENKYALLIFDGWNTLKGFEKIDIPEPAVLKEELRYADAKKQFNLYCWTLLHSKYVEIPVHPFFQNRYLTFEL